MPVKNVSIQSKLSHCANDWIKEYPRCLFVFGDGI